MPSKWRAYLLGMQLKHKLIIFFLLLAIIPLGVLGAFSYSQSSRMILDKVCQTLLESLSQVNYSIDYFVQDIEQLSMYIYGNEQVQEVLAKDGNRGPEEKHRDEKRIQAILESFIGFKNWDIQIYLLGTNGDRYFTGELLPREYNEYNENWGLFRIARLSGGNVVWDTHYAMKKTEDFGVVLSAGRQIRDINSNEPLGYVVIDIGEAEAADKYNKAQQIPGGQMYLSDRNGYVISSSPSKHQVGAKLTEAFASRVSKGTKGYFRTTDAEGEAQMVVYDTSQVTGFKLISVVPVSSLTKDGAVIRNLTLLIMIAGIVLSIWLAVVLSVNVTRPLRKLGGLMRQAETGNLNVTFPTQYDDEVGQLGRSFNKMVAQLHTLIEQDYQKQIRVQEAELKAIQAQFNPHFLYNVLDSINWMARIHKIDDISRTVLSLGELLRFSIRKGQPFITIEEDMQQIRNYLLLQKMRYRDKLNVVVEVDDEVLSYYTLKLLIQPLVENAITHGLEMKEGMGTLRIECRKEQDKVVFTVADDGAGMSEDQLKQLESGSVYHSSKSGNTAIGLGNLRKRLDLYFGEEAGLSLRSEPGAGTVVKVIIPIRESAGEELDQANDR
ncbi:histidine kinase [Cohnella sp. CIP 111063]|jgi:Predicted signal transduction protein with a C-terminal ATPase domain|uniref:cache domain-containing sensor histidine kinase n=1 Tax=unclassified Cohnella TaxID=2636738 RepID=UPI000B8C4B19|nr:MULTISPECIES: sensor histidine kinase [unclassified Cohnella]OXS56587.1 histidine kinase [Cohnella sp. CIP 111063]PRX68770.1 two-component system sensor histidine kinase YesM [Cohnella sp. SGD-V74]